MKKIVILKLTSDFLWPPCDLEVPLRVLLKLYCFN